MGSSTESDPLPFDLLSIFVVSHEFKTQLLISIRFLKFAFVKAILFSYNSLLFFQNYPTFSHRERMVSPTESDSLPVTSDLRSIFDAFHEFKTTHIEDRLDQR